jgi:hypothetical protein
MRPVPQANPCGPGVEGAKRRLEAQRPNLRTLKVVNSDLAPVGRLDVEP